MSKKPTKPGRNKRKKPVPFPESSANGDRGVGFVSQITDAGAQQFGGDCGAASLHMVLQPFGFVSGKTVDELQRAMGPCVGNAIHDLSNWDEIVCVGKQLGAKMETGTGDLRHGDITLIDYSKISNRVDQRYTGLHWLVVVAEWGETMECNDPDSHGEGSKGVLYRKAEFMAAYAARGNRYVRCRNLDRGQMVVQAGDGFVRLRQGPSLTSDVVTELKNGTVVFADELAGFFYKVKTTEGEGYAHAAYLFAERSGSANQTPSQLSGEMVDLWVKPGTGGLNFRSSPGFEHEPMGELQDGMHMRGVLVATNGFLAVTLDDGRRGFVSIDYVVREAP